MVFEEKSSESKDVMALLVRSLSLCLVLVCCVSTSVKQRSFIIDYENDRFLRDGVPFRFVGGSLHYFRLPRQLWTDRLLKLRAAGLNAVTTYIEWSQHEPSPGIYNFEDDLNILQFIDEAEAAGLLVILRPGPYICAERDMGGLPSWLLTVNPDMQLRSSDPSYIKYVNRWLDVLLPKLVPKLYGNGGPVIIVQVENEYGSYPACDGNYTNWLRDKFKASVLDDAVLVTTDGAGDNYLKCGQIPQVYTTVDFGTGTNVANAFGVMRRYEPRGPLVNMEFYPGWLTHWGETMRRVSTKAVVSTLDEMLKIGANVNFYMFFGGTNFGFMAGANYDKAYSPQLTSYDYDAPINEAGDVTEKYEAIKNIIRLYLPLPDMPPISPSSKGNYGSVELSVIGSLLDPEIRRLLGSEPVFANRPLTFEELGQSYGYVLYETEVPFGLRDSQVLSIPGVRDRALILIDTVIVSVISRASGPTSVPLLLRGGETIQILVENQGRINYGSKINDTKGIIMNVTLNGVIVDNWKITGYPLSNVSGLSKVKNCSLFKEPSFYYGYFVLPEEETVPKDTFLNLSGWAKGVSFINGHNLGRYWPVVGPQVSLYIPGVFLKLYPFQNEIILFESEFPHRNRTVVLSDKHIISMTPPLS